jgi:Tol biopolymer transport system component
MRKSGVTGLYKAVYISYENGEVRRSPDGTMIAYHYEGSSANPPRGVVIMAFDGGPATKHFDIPRAWFRWAADRRALLYVKDKGGVSNIWSQSIAGGTPTQITHFNNEEIGTFDMSRDGKRVVMSRGTIRQ